MNKKLVLIISIILLLIPTIAFTFDYPVIDIDSAKYALTRATETNITNRISAWSTQSTATSNILIYEELQKQTELLKQIEINTRE